LKVKKINLDNIRYEPVFGVSERIMPGVSNRKIGEKLKAIINYEVIEKTKSFTILRIHYAFLVPKKRSY